MGDEHDDPRAEASITVWARKPKTMSKRRFAIMAEKPWGGARDMDHCSGGLYSSDHAQAGHPPDRQRTKVCIVSHVGGSKTSKEGRMAHTDAERSGGGYVRGFAAG